MTAFIEIRDLEKRYHEGDSERIIFSDLSMNIHQGELVAMLGKSGSGKSTLLNLISGIDIPTAGRITIEGNDITHYTEHERTLFRRRHIGFIFQFFNLIPTLTVAENILLPLELNGTLDKQQSRHAIGLLEQVGLSDRIQSFPDRLSGGEQQRVAIIRALVHRPLVLLADEPTGNLDAETGREVLDLLARLVRKHRMTLVLVTHSQEATGIADRILEVRHGHLTGHQQAGKMPP
jgi:putative ABC transport system ATP-binding protein